MNERVNDSGLNNENAEPSQSSSRNGKASESPKVKKNKRNYQLSAVDIKFMKYIDSTAQEERSRSMNFFRGISDTVDKLSDENMIDFQFQVISVIKNIQQREQNRYIPTPRNQWDHGPQGYQSSTALQVHNYQCMGILQLLDQALRSVVRNMILDIVLAWSQSPTDRNRKHPCTV
ncbi:unnamed protein product [Acanthoscelides obtectus]|uniref:Uncharacterized protein n=1 Tax=Acanthoscelides obtectus TaxID=200917 RepID=A0A9P0KSZ3_ACAOB|nr:unnamed protein product [Acanthoscelides obtectus]CAK1637731.1 hypothetical protein AOBTE_LOCUS10160 [Acanthoscelides obtectus]